MTSWQSSRVAAMTCRCGTFPPQFSSSRTPSSPSSFCSARNWAATESGAPMNTEPHTASSYVIDASRSAVRFLRRIGAAASFYEQPDGVHSIASLAPAIGRAWSDMFAGVVRTNDGLTPTPVDTGSGPTFDMPGRRM